MTSGLDRGTLLEKPLPRRLAVQRAIDEMRKGPFREISVTSRSRGIDDPDLRSHEKPGDYLPFGEDIRSESSPMDVPGEFEAAEEVLEFQTLIAALIDRLTTGEDERSAGMFKRMVYAIVRENNCEHILSASQRAESQRLIGDFFMPEGWRWGHLAGVCGYATQGGCASGGFFYNKKDAFLEKAAEALNDILVEARRGLSAKRT